MRWRLLRTGMPSWMMRRRKTLRRHEWRLLARTPRQLDRTGRAPLGYDGRMGIAILSSFAAREVFVGTMSTLFPGGADTGSDEGRIRQLQQRLTQEVHPATGKPLLNTASAASLLIFYMYAMQCMSTVVIVRKELKSWPWALAQAIGFTLFAYGLALLVYQVLA